MRTLEQTLASTTDEMAIQDLWQRMVDAWNRGDGYGYAAQFTEDSDYVTFEGTRLQGRQANAESHQQLFDKWLKGSELIGTLDAVRFLSPDVAVVHASGGVRLRWQRSLAPGRRSIQTLVAVKDNGEWRFAAFHNTRIQGRNPLQVLMMILGRR